MGHGGDMLAEGDLILVSYECRPHPTRRSAAHSGRHALMAFENLPRSGAQLHLLLDFAAMFDAAKAAAAAPEPKVAAQASGRRAGSGRRRVENAAA